MSRQPIDCFVDVDDDREAQEDPFANLSAEEIAEYEAWFAERREERIRALMALPPARDGEAPF